MTNLPSDDFDNAVIATALAARVDYIVAEDPALLDYHDRLDIPIVDAQTFIMLLESEASS
jgi:predicted nucleic acid-binding protein